MSWLWGLVFFLGGLFCGYFIKDNFTKSDNHIDTDVEVKLKKNRWINRLLKKQ